MGFSIFFSPGQVARLARMTYRQLQYLVKTTRTVRPARSGPNGDEFDFLNVIEVKIVKALRDRGESIKGLRSLVEVIGQRLPEIGKPYDDLLLVTDGATKCVIGRIQDIGPALKDFFEEHCKVFTVPIGEIWSETEEDAKTLLGLKGPIPIESRVA